MADALAFRVANWDTPLWANPNRRPSRYGLAGAIVQYWSLHPMTCWAEYLRFHDIRDPDEAAELRLRPWVAEIDLSSDCLHLTFDNSAEQGLEPEALVDDDWTECQAWAGSRAGLSVLITPSAALPGTENLVMFGSKVRSRWGITPVDPSVYVPCEPVANYGEVVPDLVPCVRWRGTDHAGYEAWLHGEAQPLPPRVRVER